MVILGLLKISLLLFYLQIFVSRIFRITCYAVIGFTSASTLAVFLATTFTCLPVQAFWNRDINGRCIDYNALAYAISGSAIAQDIIILLLPLPCVCKLRMKLHRKIEVGLLFSIGAL